MHRRCAAISSSLPKTEPGARFRVEGQRLRIDPGFAFDPGRALLWSPSPLSARDIVERTELPGRVTDFFTGFDVSQAGGFGNFIPQILSLAQNGSIQLSAPFADPILRAAQPRVLDLARACLDQDASRISRGVEALMGLGTGLTPSGDDFVGGLLFAAKTLQTVYPGPKGIAPPFAIDAYSSRTHLISFTLLKDHANGHAIAPLHEIIHGLLAGESRERMYASAFRLLEVGHSTGWDLLAGLLTGLLIPLS